MEQFIKLTQEDIEKRIAEVKYHNLEGTTHTTCYLILDSGFIITGTSACLSKETYDRKIGEKIALENAMNKCWEFFGFALAEKKFLKALEKQNA